MIGHSFYCAYAAWTQDDEKNGRLRVIEYRAYEEAMKRVEELEKESFTTIMNGVDELQELKEQNKKLLEEINLLKSDVCSESKWADQYKQERDEALKLVYELESRFENADSFARAYANEFGSMRGEIEYLKKQNKKMIEALELIAGPVEFYCEVGERNKQACAQAVLEEIKK